MRMRTLGIQAVLLTSLLCAGYVAAADKALTPQQEKMGSCNQQAKEKSLAGPERKTFMSDCLKAEKATVNTQHQKMKDCNKQAAGKKGAERKALMKECLSGTKS